MRVARVDVVMPQMGESIAEGTLSQVAEEGRRRGASATSRSSRSRPTRSTPRFRRRRRACSPRSSSRKGRRSRCRPSSRGSRRTSSAASRSAAAGAAAAPAAARARPPAPEAPPPSATPVAAAPALHVRADAAASDRDRASATAARSRTGFARSRRRSCARSPPSTASRSRGLQGSGVAGRVTKRDILAVPRVAARAPACATCAPSMHAPAGVDVARPARRAVAGRRRRADVEDPRAHQRPHGRVAAHVGARHLVLRDRPHARRPHSRRRRAREFEKQTGQKLTFLPFIIKAVVEALKQYPVLNAARQRQQHHLSQAVQHRHRRRARLGPDRSGHQERRRPVALRPHESAQRPRRPRAHQAAQAAKKCRTPRSRSRTPASSARSSARRSSRSARRRSSGSARSRSGRRCITGADGEDTIAIRTCAYFSLSFDHRIVDGADADKFMAFLKETLESANDPPA